MHSHKRIAVAAIVLVVVVGSVGAAAASVAEHSDRITTLGNKEAALRASVSRLKAEHVSLREQISAARQEAKQARCDADFEKQRAAETLILAKAMAEQAEYRRCAAEVTKANSETAGFGCLIGAFISGGLGAAACAGAMAAGDDVEQACGLEPPLPTAEMAHDEAILATGISVDDDCLLDHLALVEE